MNTSALLTIAQTILRVVLGFLFTAHGWQKYNEFTIAGTQSSFAQMGIPAAEIAAPVVATLELVGGIALILGIFARPFAALLALNMIGALVMAHASSGIFVETGGFEFVLLLATAALTVTLVGPGKFSLDAALFGGTNSKLRLLA